MEVGLLFYSLTFLGGFISFFSPCVIPIIPIYFSFLAGNGKKVTVMEILVIIKRKFFLILYFLYLVFQLHSLF